MSFCFKNTPIVILYQCTEEIIPQQAIMGNVVCKKNTSNLYQFLFLLAIFNGYGRFSITIMQMPMDMENLLYPFELNGYEVQMGKEGFL